LIKSIAFINEKFSCLFGSVPTLNSDKYYIISQSNWLCDSSDLVSDFSFKPKYDLKKGVEESINWYKNQGLL
jgi:nucleoside-diphosphate-sugar epimerase